MVAQPPQLSDAVHAGGDLGTEPLAQLIQADFCVFDYVMEQSRGDRHSIQAHVGQQMGYFHGMGEVRFSGLPLLQAVMPGGEIVGLAQQRHVLLRTRSAHLVF
jgi:hypothetical protein